MDYITVKEATGKWNITERTIQSYCANEKIPGARLIGRQWFIPTDAKPPMDGRTKAAKEHVPASNYRFPVFIYSRYFRDPSELTENEQCLLKAQLLHFEGNHMQSLALCMNLIGDNLPAYLSAGVYLTIGIDSFLLGLISRYEEAVSMLDKLTACEIEHKEDFILISAALRFYINWNPEDILKIRPAKLSPEAIWYYQTMNVTIAALSGTTMSVHHLKFWESECPFFEKEGMLPILYLFFGGLGVLNSPSRSSEEREEFLNRCVKIAIENNWIPNLCRFYNFAPELMEKIVKFHGDVYYRELMKAHKMELNNWNILHSRETGLDLTGTFTPKQSELLLLISYGYTDKEIAPCIDETANSVKNKVKELMEISKTTSRASLRAYARNFYDTSFHKGSQS